MYEIFNRNFQNIEPDQNTNINPYGDQYFGENDSVPYTQGLNNPLPGYMNNNPYPLEPSLSTPSLETPVTIAPQVNYARGGKVKKKKKGGIMNSMPSLAEMIRRQGEGQDQILAHINPEEAQMLAETSGGDINPMTGLPQFGLFSNPKKWLKGSIGGAGGAILGNMLLPGVGGIIGGALGGAAGSAIRGRKDYAQAGLRGAGMGAILPSAASLLGSGASKLGMGGTGNFLSKYGADNAIMPSLGKLIGNNSVGNYVGSIGQGGNSLTAGMSAGNNIPSLAERTAAADAVAAGGGKAAEQGFVDKLIGKSSDFFSNPLNLLTTASLASSFMNKPKKAKEKSPEDLANEQKRYAKAMMLSPQELAAKESQMLAEEQMKRRVERQKFLPEERLGNIEHVYRKTHTPEEYKKHGKWLSYYNNPQFTGEPIPFKKGGKVPTMEYEVEEMEYPKGLGYFLEGKTGGQDDKVPGILNGKNGYKEPVALADGEFVIPADVLSLQGDGNSAAGAEQFYKYIKNIRKHKGMPNKLPPKAKSLASYMSMR